MMPVGMKGRRGWHQYDGLHVGPTIDRSRVSSSSLLLHGLLCPFRFDRQFGRSNIWALQILGSFSAGVDFDTTVMMMGSRLTFFVIFLDV